MNNDFKTGFKFGLSIIFGVAALGGVCAASIGYFDMAYSDGTIDSLKGATKNSFLIAGGIGAGTLALMSAFAWLFNIGLDNELSKKALGSCAASGAVIMAGLVSHMAIAFPNVAEKLESGQPEAIEQPAGQRYAVPQPGDYQ